MKLTTVSVWYIPNFRLAMKKRILFSASLFHAFNDASAVIVPMIFPLLFSQQFIIKRYSHIGILSNLGLLITFCFQIVIANYAHKFEYKHMLLLSAIGISVSVGLITLAANFVSMLFLYLLMRSFISFYHPIGIATVSKVRRKSHTRPDFSSWIEALKDIKIYIPGFIFGGACWGTTVYYAPSLFNHKLEVPIGNTGVFLALWIGTGTVMTYFFGYLSKHAGREKLSFASMIGSTVFLFILGTASGLRIAAVALILFGAFLFLIYPAFQSFVAKKVPDKNQVLAFSIVANIQMITGSIIVLISGFLSDRFGINSPFLFLVGLGILVLVNYLFKKDSPLFASRHS